MKKKAIAVIILFILIGAMLVARPSLFSPHQAIALQAAPANRVDSEGRYVPDKPSKTALCESHDGLPDVACTPGAVNLLVTQNNIDSTICVKGYTKTIRPSQSYTNALKHKQLDAYGFAGPLSEYEEDHQIPLELGGDPTSPANLWPEPHDPTPGSFDKDHVENYLHVQVCTGALSLADAQAAIATNWVSVFKAVGPSIKNY